MSWQLRRGDKVMFRPSTDVLGPLLRGGEPLQDAAHLLWEDHRDVQGQETPRGSTAHLLHHGQRLQEHDAG